MTPIDIPILRSPDRGGPSRSASCGAAADGVAPVLAGIPSPAGLGSSACSARVANVTGVVSRRSGVEEVEELQLMVAQRRVGLIRFTYYYKFIYDTHHAR